MLLEIDLTFIFPLFHSNSMLCQPESFRLELSWSKYEGSMQPFRHSFFLVPSLEETQAGKDTSDPGLPASRIPVICVSL